MPSNLQSRYQALHREMVEQLDRTAAAENHWLIYLLLGWEHFVTCSVCHYLLQVKQLQEPRWLYVAVWLVQILLAWGTIRWVSGQPGAEESPLEPLNKRIWTFFIFLCINVAVLNVIGGHPIFLFMPVLATLSSFGFTCVATFISRRFTAAGLAMFVTGILMAKCPAWQFMIYGAGWLVVLQAMAIVFYLRKGTGSGVFRGSSMHLSDGCSIPQ